MIIYRYLSRQLFTATFAVSFVLTLIIVGGRLIQYMKDAAEGRIEGTVLFSLIAYRLPGFLDLILPLGLFLGILLAYGRLYIDSEMTVLAACGIGPEKIIMRTIFPVLIMTGAVAALSLYFAPWGATHSERINHQQETQSSFETLRPGYFHESDNAARVTYTRALSDDRQRMKELFIAEDQPNRWAIVTAETGVKVVDKEKNTQYLRLEKGRRYEGRQGYPDFRIVNFDQYTIKIDPPEILKSAEKIKALSTKNLWTKTDPSSQAELAWRFSLPLLVPIVALMAIPLSRVNVRQGRYLKILPAILLYLSYLILLSNMKSAIEKEKINAVIGMCWVHGLFFTIAVTLNLTPYLTNFFRKIKNQFMVRVLN